jgi:hypothetical protein
MPTELRERQLAVLRLLAERPRQRSDFGDEDPREILGELRLAGLVEYWSERKRGKRALYFYGITDKGKAALLDREGSD